MNGITNGTAADRANAENGVTVAEMADRRERRAQEQRFLLRKYGGFVVCLNMNVAGPVKRSGLIDRVFLYAAEEIRRSLFESGTAVLLEARLTAERTGVEAMFAARGDAEEAKRVCMRIEEGTLAGRLLDIDIIGSDGKKLGRSTPRKCLICGADAAVCARSRAHSVKELREKTDALLAAAVAEHAAAMAEEALVFEVHVTPKPGLVDDRNSGANPDMDAALFVRSAGTLRPYFRRIALAAIESRLSGEDAALPAKLRALGLEAEQAMLAATGGINTHRGAIYSMGLATAAYALLAADGIAADSDLTAIRAGKLAGELGDGTLPASNGAKVRKRYGVGGAVSEAAAGFLLARAAVRTQRTLFGRFSGFAGYSKEKAEELSYAGALLRVMAALDDNNALHRGGAEGAAFVKTNAAKLLSLARSAAPDELRTAIEAFDDELTARNISCGGAADMLALARFFIKVDDEIISAKRFLHTPDGEGRSAR